MGASSRAFWTIIMRMNPIPTTSSAWAAISSARGRLRGLAAVAISLLSILPVAANPMDEEYLAAYRARPEHKALGAYSNGIHLMNQERFPEAIKQLEKAVSIDPTCYGALSALGYIYADKEEFQKALVYQDQAVKAAPKNDPGVYFRRSFTLLALFKYDQALKDIDRVLELEPNRTNFYEMRSKVHLAQKKPELALKDFDMAIKADPSSGETMYKRAALATSLGKYDKALQDFRYLAKRFPQDVDAYTGLAEVHRLTGKYQQAIDELNQALKLGPENPGFCLRTRAFCYEKLGKQDLAKKDIAEAKKHGIEKPGRASEFVSF